MWAKMACGCRDAWRRWAPTCGSRENGARDLRPCIFLIEMAAKKRALTGGRSRRLKEDDESSRMGSERRRGEKMRQNEERRRGEERRGVNEAENRGRKRWRDQRAQKRVEKEKETGKEWDDKARRGRVESG